MNLVTTLVVLGALLLQPRAPGWFRLRPFASRAYDEASGVVVASTPGLLWVLNDSGNDAELLATDTLGQARGSVPVTGARNRDWEDLAAGPCPEAPRCLYIADTGDNDLVHDRARLYRIPEPSAVGAPSARARVLHVRLPDGPDDIEAIYVIGDGTTVLIAKGRRDENTIYRVPASAWDTKETTAQRAGTLTFPRLPNHGGWVTGAALRPDGRALAVRTYAMLYRYELGPAGLPRGTPTVCDLEGLQMQGEGVAWLDDTQVVLVSERNGGVPANVAVARCPSFTR